MSVVIVLAAFRALFVRVDRFGVVVLFLVQTFSVGKLDPDALIDVLNAGVRSALIYCDLDRLI